MNRMKVHDINKNVACVLLHLEAECAWASEDWLCTQIHTTFDEEVGFVTR